MIHRIIDRLLDRLLWIFFRDVIQKELLNRDLFSLIHGVTIKLFLHELSIYDRLLFHILFVDDRTKKYESIDWFRTKVTYSHNNLLSNTKLCIIDKNYYSIILINLTGMPEIFYYLSKKVSYIDWLELHSNLKYRLT